MATADDNPQHEAEMGLCRTPREKCENKERLSLFLQAGFGS